MVLVDGWDMGEFSNLTMNLLLFAVGPMDFRSAFDILLALTGGFLFPFVSALGGGGVVFVASAKEGFGGGFAVLALLLPPELDPWLDVLALGGDRKEASCGRCRVGWGVSGYMRRGMAVCMKGSGIFPL